MKQYIQICIVYFAHYTYVCIFHLDFVQKKINRFYIKPHIYLYKGSHDKNLDDLFLLQKRNTINQNKKRSINQIFVGLDQTYRI